MIIRISIGHSPRLILTSCQNLPIDSYRKGKLEHVGIFELQRVRIVISKVKSLVGHIFLISRSREVPKWS